MLPQRGLFDEVVPKHLFDEFFVLIATRNELGTGQIKWGQTQRGYAPGIGVSKGHQPSLPPLRKRARFRGQTVSVVAKGAVKLGDFADRSGNQIGLTWVAQRTNVGVKKRSSGC